MRQDHGRYNIEGRRSYERQSRTASNCDNNDNDRDDDDNDHNNNDDHGEFDIDIVDGGNIKQNGTKPLSLSWRP